MQSQQPEVVVLDLELDSAHGPLSGLALIPELLAIDDSLRILVLTGHGSEQHGIEALKSGAASFLTKPIDPPHLLALIDDAARYSALKRRNQALEAQLLNSLPAVGLASRNPAMQRVLGELQFAKSTVQPVLILGETGTGKGLIAEAIHQLQRPAKPFVRAQPSFGSPDLIQSELFGHERGSFTGATADRRGLIEEADGGTLFLDEIDALPAPTQVLLLEVLQSKRFRRVGSNKERRSNFRLLAASNCPLKTLKARIRADLFHRISHLTLALPALRERREDIGLLSIQFLREISRREKLRVSAIRPAALNRLGSYSWPGNVRELQAVIEQAVFRARFAGRTLVEAGDLPLAPAAECALASNFRDQVDGFERGLLNAALEASGHNLSGAARSLGLERSQFKRCLKRHGLAVP